MIKITGFIESEVEVKPGDRIDYVFGVFCMEDDTFLVEIKDGELVGTNPEHPDLILSELDPDGIKVIK